MFEAILKTLSMIIMIIVIIYLFPFFLSVAGILLESFIVVGLAFVICGFIWDIIEENLYKHK